MISRLIFAICIVVPATVFSTTLSIDVEKPYSMGTKTLVSNQSYSYIFNYDTIKFSNGASLSFCLDGMNYTEWYTCLIGLSIDSSKDILSAGFRYSPAAVWQKDTLQRLHYRGTTFYNNADTSAYLSKRFPDSLVPPDSLYESYILTFRHKWGKRLFAYHSACTPGNMCRGPHTVRVASFNNILYLRTKKNKLKFQVINIFQNSHPSSLPHPLTVILVDSIRILWSADSLGNGIFKDDATVRSLQNPSGPSAQKSGGSTINRRTLHDLIQSEAPVVLYNFMGQKTGFISNHKLHHVSAGNSAAGILFYTIDFPDKPVERGKVLVR